MNFNPQNHYTPENFSYRPNITGVHELCSDLFHSSKFPTSYIINRQIYFKTSANKNLGHTKEKNKLKYPGPVVLEIEALSDKYIQEDQKNSREIICGLTRVQFKMININ